MSTANQFIHILPGALEKGRIRLKLIPHHSAGWRSQHHRAGKAIGDPTTGPAQLLSTIHLGFRENDESSTPQITSKKSLSKCLLTNRSCDFGNARKGRDTSVDTWKKGVVAILSEVLPSKQESYPMPSTCHGFSRNGL